MIIGTLAIMGCGADSVQYPGAPTISIKKTGWNSERVGTTIWWRLKCRLEAEDPLPYDIEVPIEIKWRYESFIDSIDEVSIKGGSKMYTAKMQAGRSVLGFIGGGAREDTLISATLSLSLVPWNGSGDDAYNIGSPNTLHESWRKP